ncbi:hypothetical protein PMI18_05083 [Pseudomonas sp. GM102]|nr:hypothetical protein PMI18_05083 [Pseudomonas sp. GM102]
MTRKVTCVTHNALKTSNAYLYLEAYDLFVETADTSTLIVQINTLRAAEQRMKMSTSISIGTRLYKGYFGSISVGRDRQQSAP